MVFFDFVFIDSFGRSAGCSEGAGLDEIALGAGTVSETGETIARDPDERCRVWGVSS